MTIDHSSWDIRGYLQTEPDYSSLRVTTRTVKKNVSICSPSNQVYLFRWSVVVKSNYKAQILRMCHPVAYQASIRYDRIGYDTIRGWVWKIQWSRVGFPPPFSSVPKKRVFVFFRVSVRWDRWGLCVSLLCWFHLFVRLSLLISSSEHHSNYNKYPAYSASIYIPDFFNAAVLLHWCDHNSKCGVAWSLLYYTLSYTPYI